jgi:hypothetical protein
VESQISRRRKFGARDKRGTSRVGCTQEMLNRGIAAGTRLGLAIGLMIALFFAMRPDLFTLLR